MMAGFWSIIIPEAVTNLVTNPSIFNATTGFTAVGGSIARDTGFMRRGIASLKITPTAGLNDGAYFGTVALTNTETYTLSVDILGSDGEPYSIYFANTSGVKQGSSTDFIATGEWERQEVTWTCTSTASYRLYIVKNNDANTDIFYADGLQCENKAYGTTYCDGDQPGCMWAAIEHASVSQRDGQSRLGGRVHSLDDYGFVVKDFPGIGMPPIQHQVQEQPLLPGAILRESKTEARVFDLVANQIGDTFGDLHSKRKDLLDAIKPDRVIESQPFILRYSGANSEKPIEIRAVYDSGYQFKAVKGFTETLLPLRFISYDEPFFYEIGNVAVQLSTGTTLSNASGIVAKKSGIWSALGTGTNNGAGYALRVGLNDGYVYLGGGFSAAGGVGNCNGIGRWNLATEAWEAMDTGVDGTPGLSNAVWSIACAADGNVYAGGSFTTMSGVSNTSRIARWDGSNWNAMGTGALDEYVEQIEIGPDGNVYAVGAFNQMGGVSNTEGIAMWDGSAWNAVGNGFNNVGYDLTFAPNGDLYACGLFTQAGGVTVNFIAKWDGTAWTALAGGCTGGYPNTVLWTTDGRLIAAGPYDTIGGIDTNQIASWNGSAWSPLGDGLYRDASNDPLVFAVHQYKNYLYVGGYFFYAGGISLPDKMALWNGTSWAPFDIDLPGDPEVWNYDMMGADLYVAFSTSGTANIPSNQTVTNEGSRTAYPTIVLERSGGTSAKVIYIKNDTTGATFYLDYELIDGEKLTIDLTPRNKRITSNQFGSVIHSMLRPSDFADFFLLPGDNQISVMVDEAGSPTLTAYMTWRNTHWSADGVAI
jgi:hypothetical protein